MVRGPGFGAWAALAVGVTGCVPRVDRGPVAVEIAAQPVAIVELREEASPNIYLQALVAAGSVADPIGAEGLANLTARALVEAGAGDRSGPELAEALHPTGNGVEILVDRDWVSVRLRCHRDHADLCVEVFTDVLAAPRFEVDGVARVRDAALYAVGDGLLADHEALGAAVLDAWIFDGHPYGHPPAGRTGVLGLLDADDARRFHRAHYVREAMVVGIGGSYTASHIDALNAGLQAVPTDMAPASVLMPPVTVAGRSLVVVDTTEPLTGWHLGHPVVIDRRHEDWPALYVALLVFGAHRQSFGRLFEEIRTQRGLNYGAYAYPEPFVQRGWDALPENGVSRRQSYLSLWLRPASVENGPFTLKLAIDELERLVEDGLTQAELDRGRAYAVSHLPLEATSTGRRLAYALDAAATGFPNPLTDLPGRLADVTPDQVNAALKRHVRPGDLRIVGVSRDAAEVVRRLTERAPTPIVYADVEPSPEQAARDAEIAAKALGIAPSDARVAPAEGIFR